MPADDPTDAAPSWPAQWLRGALELCVLAIVAEGETYGYAISQRLAAARFGQVKGGTLYPILLRLEEDGLVASAWQAGAGGRAARSSPPPRPGGRSCGGAGRPGSRS